jgi:GT2 family glycosyltransferase
MRRPRVVAVVVAYDGGQLLADCVGALVATSGDPPSIVLVDNASRDGAPQRVAQRYANCVRLLAHERNLGFAGGVNSGIAIVDAASDPQDVYVLVNQDCLVERDALRALTQRLWSDPGIGIAGGCLLEPGGEVLQHAGGRIRLNGLTEHVGRGLPASLACDGPTEPEYVTGALFSFRAETWRRLGPFDEGYHPVYFEDVDFCVRARAMGLRVVYEPRAVAIHHEAFSSKRGSRVFLQRYHESRMRFVVQHAAPLHGWYRILRAEAGWLMKRRRIAEIRPVLRAYRSLPAAYAAIHRQAGSKARRG